MGIESNNKRYYLIIAGILVFTVLSIFVVFALGLGGLLMFKLDDTNSNNGVFPLNSKDGFSSNTGNIEIVSVPEKAVFGPFDTEPGEIEIFDQYLPTDPLPLKITDEYLDDYWVAVGTYGGYTWVSGYIKVMQAKSDERIWENIVGYIEITATEIEGPHGWTVYNLTFSVDGDHPIILDSNHPPDSPLGDFWVKGPEDLDKWVWLKVWTTWKGCPLPEQQFMVILTQITIFPESPTPE
ncbi:MAG: hypothetical protein ACW986_14505 [Promethearchaeota archaeon]|jgi:hypothetical protein